MRAVWFRFRAELRTRWRTWLGLASLIGLVGGAVSASAIGALRTDTAYERFLVRQAAFDVIAGCVPSEDLAPGVRPPACDLGDLARLPQVLDAALLITFGPGAVEVRTEDGRPAQPDPDDFGYTGPGEITLAASPDGRFGTDLNRLKILAGRRPDPIRADEVAVPLELADRLDMHVGDELLVTFLVPTEGENAGEPARLPPRTFRIVAVEAAPFEIKPASGQYESFIHLTPAALSGLAEDGLRLDEAVALRLRPGTDVDDFAAELERRGAGVGPRQAEHAALVERSIRPQAVALWLLAALAALTALTVLGQALARQTFLESAEHHTMRALGLSRIQLFGLGILRAAAIGAASAVVAAVVAFLLSPLTPIGLARTVESNPGLSLHGAGLVMGAVANMLVVPLLVALPAWRLARVAGTGLDPTEAAEARRGSLVANAAVRAALPPAGITGVRMALEPGRGRTAVPVRSTLLGVALGVAATAAALTFGASLSHLFATPRLQGLNWDAAVPYPHTVDEATGEFVPFDEETVRSLLSGHADIDGFAPGTFFRPFPVEDHALELGPNKVPVDLLTFGRGQGSIGPTVIRGRAPSEPGEILVGTGILDELGLDVGDTVESVGRIANPNRPDSVEEISAPLEIVGVGVVQTPGGQLGLGAAMTLDGLRALNPDARPDVVWLRFAANVDRKRVLSELAKSAGENGAPDLVEFKGSEDVLNLRQVEKLPLVLAGLMGVLAVGVLAHALVSAVRARRRDLAVLMTLGFLRRQVGMTVAWQATTIAALTLLAGIPLGIAAGRWAWRLFAEELGVLPEAATSLWSLFLVVLTTFVLANLVAAVPGWLAARTRPAVVLRAA